jgi:PAS domain S-box-containing protein
MHKYEKLLSAVFDASLDGLLILSDVTEKPVASLSFRKLFPGWEQFRFNEQLDGVRQFYSKHVSNVDEFMDLIHAVRLSPGDLTGRINLFDGRILELTGRVINNPDGGSIEIWTFRDISDQCRKDAELQLRLQLITAVLDASNDGILTIAKGFHAPLGNVKCSMLFPGWENAFRFGQPIDEIKQFLSQYIVNLDEPIELISRMKRTSQGYQTMLYHKDGRLINMSGKIAVSGQFNDETLEIYTLKDVTDEIHSRNRLMAMQLTVDNLSEPVVWFDVEGNITYVNMASCRTLGYDSPEEILGNTVWSLSSATQTDVSSCIWNEILSTENESKHIKFDQTTLTKKDGELLHCTILADYISQDNKPFWAMCFHDLSEQIKRIKAEQAAQARTDFLAHMSHEIRTPMNAIIGLSEMTRREYGSPAGLEYVTEINNAGKNLISIINDILDFSKMESGYLDIIASNYETGSLLQDVLSITRIKLMETPLEFIVDISSKIPAYMTGDVGRIRQILLNLLSNAVKYTEKGFVKFSASGEVLSENSIRLTFIIKDSGVGIKDEDFPKLFEKFLRLDEKKNKNIVGTGLGLIISRNLCKAMGGDITVQSEYGKGSIFTASIIQSVSDWRPLGNISDYSERRTEEFHVTFTAPEASVLIVDDFPSNLLVARGALTPYQMKLFTCESGYEALKLVQEHQFDLVLMDHMMPDMDGVEATCAIRALPEEIFRTLPIVALTANAVSGMKEMFLENGFNDFISKPIEVSKLDAMLKKWIPANKRFSTTKKAITTNESVSPPKLGFHKIDGLDVIGGISRVGSYANYKELLTLFKKEAEAVLEQLSREPDLANLKHFTTLVHGLKTSLANIGAIELSQAAAALEQAGRQEDMSLIGDNLSLFRIRLTDLTGQIAVNL